MREPIPATPVEDAPLATADSPISPGADHGGHLGHLLGAIFDSFPTADAALASNLVYLADVWSVKNTGKRLTWVDFERRGNAAWSEDVLALTAIRWQSPPDERCTKVMGEITAFVSKNGDVEKRISEALPLAWTAQNTIVDFHSYSSIWAGLRKAADDIDAGLYVGLLNPSGIDQNFRSLILSAAAWRRKARGVNRRPRRSQRAQCSPNVS